MRADSAGSLWVLIPKAGAGILLSVALILVRYWFEFGKLSVFAFVFAGFLAMFQILLIVGLRFRTGTEAHTTVKARGDKLDMLAAWWLMACFLGAFIGWGCGQFAEIFPAYSKVFTIGEILFTIILPITTMLPNVRYVRRNSAFVQIPLLFFVTLLPLLVGIDAVPGFGTRILDLAQ